MGVGNVHEDDDDTLDDPIHGEVIGESDQAEMLRVVQQLLHGDAPEERPSWRSTAAVDSPP